VIGEGIPPAYQDYQFSAVDDLMRVLNINNLEDDVTYSSKPAVGCELGLSEWGRRKEISNLSMDSTSVVHSFGP
jgi:hypothetical protein